MLGIGELIFVLVIVVQGVAAIAAASQKKKKRAAERAKEIAAEEARLRGPAGRSPAAPPVRLVDDAVSEKRARALQEREARKAQRKRRQEEQLLKVQQFIEKAAGEGVTGALLGTIDRGLPNDDDARSRQTQVSVSADNPVRIEAAPAPPRMAGSGLTSGGIGRTLVDDMTFAAFERKRRSPKQSGFSSLKPSESSVPVLRRTGNGRGRSLRGALRDPRSLRQAIVLKTLLEPPVALRDEPNTVG